MKIDLLSKDLPDIGTKDALHVPMIVVEAVGYIEPGDKVRLNTDFTMGERPNEQENGLDTWHGIANPFVDKIDYDGKFVVLLKPGVTSPVRHEFKITAEPHPLQKELDRHRQEDPDCAECWQIEGDKIIRW